MRWRYHSRCFGEWSLEGRTMKVRTEDYYPNHPNCFWCIVSRRQVSHKIWHLHYKWRCYCRSHSNQFLSPCSDFRAFWKGDISFPHPFQTSFPFQLCEEVCFQRIRFLAEINFSFACGLVTIKITIPQAATHVGRLATPIKFTLFTTCHPNHLPLDLSAKLLQKLLFCDWWLHFRCQRWFVHRTNWFLKINLNYGFLKRVKKCLFLLRENKNFRWN